MVTSRKNGVTGATLADFMKDKDKIEKMIAGIDKGFDTAARKFKGVSTTIKKAG